MLCLITCSSRFGFQFAIQFRLEVSASSGFLARHAVSLSHFLFPRSNFPLPLLHLSSISLALGGIPMNGCCRSSSPEVSSLSLPLSSPLPPSSLHRVASGWSAPVPPLHALLPPPSAWPPACPRPAPCVPWCLYPCAPPRGPLRLAQRGHRRGPAASLAHAAHPCMRKPVPARAALAHIVFKFSLNLVLNLV
jgi:hypothetical protein